MHNPSRKPQKATTGPVWEPQCQNHSKFGLLFTTHERVAESPCEGLIISWLLTLPDLTSLNTDASITSPTMTPLGFTSTALSIIQQQSNYCLESEPSIVGIMCSGSPENDEVKKALWHFSSTPGIRWLPAFCYGQLLLWKTECERGGGGIVLEGGGLSARWCMGNLQLNM